MKLKGSRFAKPFARQPRRLKAQALRNRGYAIMRVRMLHLDGRKRLLTIKGRIERLEEVVRTIQGLPGPTSTETP